MGRWGDATRGAKEGGRGQDGPPRGPVCARAPEGALGSGCAARRARCAGAGVNGRELELELDSCQAGFALAFPREPAREAGP